MVHTKFKQSRLTCAIGVCLTVITIFGSAVEAHAENTRRVIVSYKTHPASNLHAMAAVNRARGSVKMQIHGTNALVAIVPESALKALKNDPNVESVEEDAIRYIPEKEMKPDAYSFAFRAEPRQGSRKPYVPGQRIPYGVELVQADKLLAEANNTDRKICIIDSGYDRSHEDLSAGTNVTGEYDEGTGWWYTDENGHGTHVAGTIAALNNGVGVVGVVPTRSIKLHIVKVFDADGWAYSSEMADAANKCADAGANIISMSLSGPNPSSMEQRTFDILARKGILSFAAASNAGTTAMHYPAGYNSVVSVGALDINKEWAPFSNYNREVELSGPGVNVLSTVPMGSRTESLLSVGGKNYAPGSLDGSPHGSVTAPIADFGLGTAVDPAMAGKVCLISRGSISFGVKVQNCEASGGVGAIIYNNAPAGFTGTLGDTVSNIPSVTASGTESETLKTQIGELATVTVKGSPYAYFDGTSMATLHVSAVAALVWGQFPECNAAQIRATLAKSAEDLGEPGRDHKYGYGLVQAKAAYDRLKTFGCNN